MTAPKPTLLRRLEARVRHELGIPFRWVKQSFLGHELVLRDNTLWHEPDYDEAWLHASAQHAEIVFDVGANVGQSSLITLLGTDVRQVVLVEANWEALSVAAQNLIRNNLAPRARFIAAFASDVVDAKVDFWTVGTGAAGSMFQSHAVSAAKQNRVSQVATTTLDRIAETTALPDLVKIDVEGAESKVLEGARAIATQRKTRFHVEMHSFAELPMTKNAADILAWARSVDHAVWYLAEAQRIETPEPIQHRGRCHLLLQPSDWPYPEWLRGIKQSTPLPGD